MRAGPKSNGYGSACVPGMSPVPFEVGPKSGAAESISDRGVSKVCLGGSGV